MHSDHASDSAHPSWPSDSEQRSLTVTDSHLDSDASGCQSETHEDQLRSFASPESLGVKLKFCRPLARFPEFLHAPNDQRSPSGPPQDASPPSRTLGTCAPTSFPRPAASRGGASAAAPRHLRNPGSQSPGSGESRRPQPNVAAPGLLRAAPRVAPPATGARPKGASAARRWRCLRIY